MKLRQELRQAQSQKLDPSRYDFTGWDWKDLGFICKGVRNDEGYCTVYAHLGRPDKDSEFTVIRIREKYFYTLSGNPHHIEECTWNWNDNLDFFINEYSGPDNRTYTGPYDGGAHTGGFRRI
jgi:hypothetical protein